jgi:hypothetical protein
VTFDPAPREGRVLTERDRQIVALVQRYRVLTALQLASLLGASRRVTQRRLQALRRARELRRLRLPCAGGRGEFLYHASTRAPAQVQHLLGVSATTVALRVHGPRRGVVVDVHFGLRMAGVVPDAVVVLTRDGRQSLLFLEYDRDTEPLSTLRSKAEMYQVALDSRAYTALPELTDLIIAGFRVLIVAQSESRAAAIARVVRAVDPRPVFWVATTARVNDNPFGPVWVTASAEAAQSLIRDVRQPVRQGVRQPGASGETLDAPNPAKTHGKATEQDTLLPRTQVTAEEPEATER